jgi:hypothetical protein
MVFEEIDEQVGVEADSFAFAGKARYHDRRSRFR